MRDPFKVLGIEPTSDKKQIKKVYAKLAARYHPEEYPEKWQEIHEAMGFSGRRTVRDMAGNDRVVCARKEK